MDKSRARNDSIRKAYQLANIYTTLNQYFTLQLTNVLKLPFFFFFFSLALNQFTEMKQKVHNVQTPTSFSFDTRG